MKAMPNKTVCTSLPEDEHLDVRNLSKIYFEQLRVHPQEELYVQFLMFNDIDILIHLSTAIGLTPGGSTHLHINNTQNITINNKTT
jgi:hypothetical protein